MKKKLFLLSILTLLLGCNDQETQKHYSTTPAIIYNGNATTNKNGTLEHAKQDIPPLNGELIINSGKSVINNQDTEIQSNNPKNMTKNENKTVKADIVKVFVSGTEENYNFSVTIKSEEIGCNQYADWWEILDEKGDLVYRRILAHSHPKEQPFTRSGRSIKINQNEKIYIRAHMNNKGYSGNIFSGTVKNGFLLFTRNIHFKPNLEEQLPLPKSCAF